MPDYEAYKTYSGKLGESAFKALLPRAKELVKSLIFPNEPNTESKRTAFEHAVFACVDGLAMYGDNGFKSLKIGAFSAEGQNPNTAIYSAVRAELVGSGLLYMGLA
jgi:hypothetical protein